LLANCFNLSGQVANEWVDRLHFVLGMKYNSTIEQFGESGASGWGLLNSPVLGVEYEAKRIPASISFQANKTIIPGIGGEDNFPGAFQAYRREHTLQFKWRFKRFALGLGHYWYKSESFGNYVFLNAIEKARGILFSISVPIDWVDIELRSHIAYDPYFAALVGLESYSIALLSRIPGSGNRDKEQPENSERFIQFRGLIGARFFSTEGVKTFTGENMEPIGAAPLLGVEFYFPKFKTSVNLERDWWASINAGSPVRDFKGYMNTTFLGLRYHHALKNNRRLRIGAGYSFITDYDVKVRADYTEPGALDLFYYQVKGIGATLSYEILPKLDIEVKNTFPLKSVDGHHWRFLSLGTIYRFAPGKA